MAVLLLAPLPLGSNRPWSWSLLAAAVGVLAATWPIVAARAGDYPWVALRRVAVPAMLFGGVLLWSALQASTLLPAELAHPIWHDAATALPPELASPPRIAVDADAAVTGVMRLLCYAAAFWLALQHGRSGNRARLLLGGVALAGGLYAVYGLAVHFAGTEVVLWLSKWAYAGYLTSTFVNPNSYAAYAGLGLIAALAAVARRIEGRQSPALAGMLLGTTGLYVFSALALLMALPATGSRAGNAAVGIGVLTLAAGAWIARRPPERRWRAAMAALGLAAAGVAIAAGWLVGGDLPADAASRLQVYAITVDLIAARPLTGYGLGAFPSVFAAARPETVSQVWTQAHDTYLELTLELGLPAAAALLAAVLWLVVLCVRGMLIRRRDRLLPVVGLASSALIGSHALLDFSVQVPAVAVTWLALLGVAVAQSRSSAEAVTTFGADGASAPRAAPAPRSAAP